MKDHRSDNAYANGKNAVPYPVRESAKCDSRQRSHERASLRRAIVIGGSLSELCAKHQLIRMQED